MFLFKIDKSFPTYFFTYRISVFIFNYSIKQYCIHYHTVCFFFRIYFFKVGVPKNNLLTSEFLKKDSILFF